MISNTLSMICHWAIESGRRDITRCHDVYVFRDSIKMTAKLIYHIRAWKKGRHIAYDIFLTSVTWQKAPTFLLFFVIIIILVFIKCLDCMNKCHQRFTSCPFERDCHYDGWGHRNQQTHGSNGKVWHIVSREAPRSTHLIEVNWFFRFAGHLCAESFTSFLLYCDSVRLNGTRKHHQCRNQFIIIPTNPTLPVDVSLYWEIPHFS